MPHRNNLSGRVMITAALLLPVSLFAVSTYADDRLVITGPALPSPALHAHRAAVRPAPVYETLPPGPAAVEFVVPAGIR
jgi:hypothetical protein